MESSSPKTKRASDCTCKNYYEDKCEIVKELGSGFFGTVYQVREKESKREFAMKIPRFATNKEKVQIDFEEVWNAKTKNDNLIQFVSAAFYEHGDTGKGHLLIFMELCSNKTLATWMKDHSTVESRSLAKVRPYMFQILSALTCIHGHGVIHRDIKPDNVFFADDAEYEKVGGTVKIGDFGMILRCVDVDGDWQRKKTEEKGSFLNDRYKNTKGGDLYGAPEKLVDVEKKANENNRTYNNKIDVFSYALISAELLYPFKDDDERKKAFEMLRIGKVPECLKNQSEEAIDFIKAASIPKEVETVPKKQIPFIKEAALKRLYAKDLRKHPFFSDYEKLPKELSVFIQCSYSKEDDRFEIVKMNKQKFLIRKKDTWLYENCPEVADVMRTALSFIKNEVPEYEEKYQEQLGSLTGEQKIRRSLRMHAIRPFFFPNGKVCRLGITASYFLDQLANYEVPRGNKAAMIERIKTLQLAITGTYDNLANYDRFSTSQVDEYLDALYGCAREMKEYRLTYFGLEPAGLMRCLESGVIKMIPGICVWNDFKNFKEEMFETIKDHYWDEYKKEHSSTVYTVSTCDQELQLREDLIPIAPSGNFALQEQLKATMKHIIHLGIPNDTSLITMRIQTLTRVLSVRSMAVYCSAPDHFLVPYLHLLINACKFILKMSEEGVYFNVCFSNSFAHVALSALLDGDLVLPSMSVFIGESWIDWSNIGWKTFAHISREHKIAREAARDNLGKQVFYRGDEEIPAISPKERAELAMAWFAQQIEERLIMGVEDSDE